MWARVAVWLSAAAMLAAVTGCSAGVMSPLKRAAKTTSSAALEQTLSTLERAESRERIRQLLATPEIRQAIREAASDAANTALVERVATVGTRSAMDEASTAWPKTLGPAIQDTVTGTMDSLQGRLQGVLRAVAIGGIVLGALVLLLLIWGVRTQVLLTRMLKAFEHGTATKRETPSPPGPLRPREPLEA